VLLTWRILYEDPPQPILEPPAPAHAQDVPAPRETEDTEMATSVEKSSPPAIADQDTASDARQVQARAFIAGRVVEEGSEAPIEGVTVTLLVLSKPVDEVVTAEDGAFRFDRACTIGTRVDARPPEGWIAHRRRVRLEADELTGERLVVLHFAREPGAVLRGVAVDRASGEPLADFGLWFERRGASGEFVRTGADGRFETRQHWSPGTLLVQPKDDPGDTTWSESAIRIEVPDPTREVLIGVDAGPTFHARLEMPAGVELADVRATLRGRYSEFTAGDRAWDEGVRVRAGSPCWIRFPWLSESVYGAGPWRLWVFTRDLAWSASTPVQTIRGTVPGVLDLALEPSARIGGIVRDDRNPLRGAAVNVQRIEGAELSSGTHVVGPDGEGRFLSSPLLPGIYRVRVLFTRYEPRSLDVELHAGERASLDMVLERPSTSGSISGTLRSATGRYAPRAWASLRPVGGGQSLSEEVRWKTERGAKVGHFRFEDVPAGEHELTIFGRNAFPWIPDSIRVRAPADAVEFVCHDDVPRARFIVEVYDDESGEPVEGFDIRYELKPDSSTGASTMGSHVTELGLLPLDVRFGWRISASGYMDAKGDVGAFVSEGERGGENIRRARVRLKRGWSTRLLAIDGSLKPIQGAEFLLDGVLVGSSDERGMLEVALPAKPARLEVHYRDWRIIKPKGLDGRLPPEQEPESLTWVVLGPP
jgi:hypothetical protein